MKKLLGILVIAFVLFYVLTQPESAADAVRGVVDVIGDLFAAVIDFINALFD